jgi:hypothetical protein
VRAPTYFVLASLLDGPLHGYAIIQRGEQPSGGRVRLAIRTLYTALDRLTARGPVAPCLSMLWAALGALGAGYNFMLSLHVPEASYLGVQPWVGESSVIITAAGLGALAWVLLTVPVLVAGLVRLYRRRLRAGRAAGLAAIAWAGTWIVGLVLMYQVADWHPTAASIWAGNCNVGAGCSLAGYRHAVVSWEELAVLAGWLALSAAMALILACTRSLGRLSPAAS